jgi:hypothetical protein
VSLPDRYSPISSAYIFDVRALAGTFTRAGYKDVRLRYLRWTFLTIAVNSTQREKTFVALRRVCSIGEVFRRPGDTLAFAMGVNVLAFDEERLSRAMTLNTVRCDVRYAVV